MRLALLTVLSFPMLAVTALPLQAAERVVDEAVFELSMFGNPMGHMLAKELEIGEGEGMREAVRVTYDMSIRRMNDATKIGVVLFERFGADGGIEYFKVESRMGLGVQISEGWVEGEHCRIVERDGLTGRPYEKRIPWDPETVSAKQMEADYKDLIRGPVGGSIAHKVFLPDMLKTAPTTATLVGAERRKTYLGMKKLNRIEVVVDIGVPVRSQVWIDDEGELFEEEFAMGPLKVRAVRVAAMPSEPVSASIAADLFTPTIIKINPSIYKPEKTDRLVYLLRFSPEAADRTFYEDEGQRILERQGDIARLEVRGQRFDDPFPMSRVQTPDDVYLSSSPFIQSDDAEIRAAARKAVEGEPDAWKRAKLLETWVDRHITESNFATAFASAKETFDSRSGDCTEHAALLTAMCRAAGLPTRAAEGLIYVRSLGGFGYHMWTEVYLDGWRDLDATRPSENFDAVHIQLDVSALDTGMAGDLAVGLLRFFGTFEIEVESVEHRDDEN